MGVTVVASSAEIIDPSRVGSADGDLFFRDAMQLSTPTWRLHGTM